MGLFRKIFSKKATKIPLMIPKEISNDNFLKIPERYFENSKGDFYVENQVCISCGAPEAEAPDLIEHSKLEYRHCYFKKQPTTADELDRAISAMQVSCISGIRYGGKDQAILKRLYNLGLKAECDYTLTDSKLIRNFNFFKTTMPNSRKADFYLGGLGGRIFIDFNLTNDKRISLCRISFDGYGCCELRDKTNFLNLELSKIFTEELKKEELKQENLTPIVLEIIKINKENIWKDALEEYNLIDD